MATNVTRGVSLSCLLCLKEYNIPRTLPCHHTYCEECLKHYIENLSGAEFVCPVGCNVVGTIDSSIQMDELIKTFPINVLYASLAKSARLDERECDHCPNQTMARRATMWCKNCEGSLCRDCTVDHRKRRISVNHDIIDIAKEGNHVVESFRVEVNCPCHKGRQIVSFCSVHSELCCSECCKTRHVGCTLWTITDASQRQVANMNFEQMARKISDLSNKQKDNMKELDSQYEQHLVSMNTHIMNAKDKLDTLHKLFQVKTREEKKARKRQLEILQQQTRMFQTELENNSKICSSITKGISQNQSFVVLTQIREQTRKHFEAIQYILDGYIDVRVDLQITDTIEHVESLKSVGEVTETLYQSVVFKDALNTIEHDLISEHSSSSDSYPKNDSSYCSMDLPTSEHFSEETTVKHIYPEQQLVKTPRLGVPGLPRPCVPSRPELVLGNTLKCVISVKSSDLGNRTWLTGGTYLPDGRLILADFGNGQILLCDERYNIIRKEKMKVGPQEIAYCEVQNAVYVRTGPQIVKFSLDPFALRQIGTIELPAGTTHQCGIALYEDTLVVGSLGSVLLMSRDGKVLRVIRRQGKPYSVTICRPLQRFCYMHNDDIVYCSMNGDEVSRYNRKHYECKKVRGMGFDMYGHLYLCCFTQPRGYIYQLPQTGQKGRVLSYQGSMKRPRFVMYHPRKQEFIVTSFQERVAFEVAVFD
ncbi:probable E3 ubiquitin-protein ligase MID2 [Mizuhopecten yessoensis]|uniref:E3 ubiquitin-protein ligase TRIM56 n=1 Tax=Mizuhopecten yessoensis TaxID=6573 RepID=A0A210QL19_MIZYE|nr:probable E3 ubiquitin-protein ligase MID2 [Mizuhopecten yessoensis]OWF49442.1 E3 ubiquitin-protein ligase TRIM56 [Mizuhopecten yessoensis]